MTGWVHRTSGALSANQDIGLKIATPVETLIGQLLFVYLADVLGHKRVYGLELSMINIIGHRWPGPFCPGPGSQHHRRPRFPSPHRWPRIVTPFIERNLQPQKLQNRTPSTTSSLLPQPIPRPPPIRRSARPRLPRRAAQPPTPRPRLRRRRRPPSRRRGPAARRRSQPVPTRPDAPPAAGAVHARVGAAASAGRAGPGPAGVGGGGALAKVADQEGRRGEEAEGGAAGLRGQDLLGGRNQSAWGGRGGG